MSGIDEGKVIPLRENACVLLSGGMDSTACLHWALAHFRNVRALGFDYGQPHRNAELPTAGALAAKLGVRLETAALADTLASGLLDGVPKHEATPTTAIHRAFVPGRNLVFLSIALARAAQWWPEGDLALVIGACWEDTAGFPDCGEKFLDSATKTLGAAVARKVSVCAPYVRMTKREMLRDVELRFPSGLADIQASWSCYRGDGPCGECTPCVLRKMALDAADLPDLCRLPTMTGGDVARDAALRNP